MRRGTTPTLTFTTPYPAESISSGFITFAKGDTVVLDIPFDDPSVVISDYSIQLTLTQTQTLSFNAKFKYSMQIRAMLLGNVAVASNIITIPIGSILKEGTI